MLKLYFMDDIDEWSFKEQLTDCCYKCKVCEDEAYAMYFASRLPGEKCFDKIMRKIEEIEARDNQSDCKKGR